MRMFSSLNWRSVVLGIVFLGIVFLIGAGGVLVGDFHSRPFFVDLNSSISPVNLKLFEFKPLILWSFEKDGAVFIKTCYLDKDKKFRLVDLWVTGNVGEAEMGKLPYVNKDKERIDVASLDDARKYFRFGQRLSVIYITGEFLLEYRMEQGRDKLCVNAPRVCQVYDFLTEGSYSTIRFEKEGSDFSGKVLPILSIYHNYE